MAGLNEICITQTAATVLALLGEKKGAEMAEPDRRVLAQAEKLYGAGGCDRVFMYHPDAVAMWIYENTGRILHSWKSGRRSGFPCVPLSRLSRRWPSLPCTAGCSRRSMGL